MGNRTYSIIRAHGLITHLLSREEIARLIELEGDEFLKEISRTEYAPFIGGEELRDPKKADTAPFPLLGKRISFLISILDEETREFLTSYMAKYDLENLRRIVLSRGEEVSLIPTGEFVKGLKSSIEQGLPSERARGKVRKILKIVEEWRELHSEDPGFLELSLERAYREILLSSLKGGIKKELERLTTWYLDGRSIILALKFIQSGETWRLRELSGIMSPRVYNVLATASTIAGALSLLSEIAQFSGLAKTIRELYSVTRGDWVFDYAFYCELLRTSEREGRRGPISAAYLMWYVIRAEWEARALRAILIGKIEEIPPQELRKVVLIV